MQDYTQPKRQKSQKLYLAHFTHLNKGVPQTTHLYIPGALWCVYSPSKALGKQ